MPRLLFALVMGTLQLILVDKVHSTTLEFNYSGTTPGVTATPLSQTVGGVTATFSSDQDPGGFEVDASSATSFAGLMIDTNFGNPALATQLVVNFSTPIAAISLPFITDGPGPLTLQAYADVFPPGTLPVGGASVIGTVPPFPAVFPEGVISFGGAEFSVVVLTDAGDPAFGIGALTVTLPSAAPEPAGLPILAAGLIALGMVRRRAGKPI